MYVTNFNIRILIIRIDIILILVYKAHQFIKLFRMY
jgi:hypothetical protein